jgi:adenylate cyclase
VGPVGGLTRVILGEAPALAARLQALNRTYGTDVLLSGEAAVGLGADCPVRELDRVRVRGKDDVVVVHELLPQPDPVPSPVRYRFARALRFYRGRRWSDALEAMAELAPHDPAAAAFLVRCQRYLRVPPPESWDGVYLDERSA